MERISFEQAHELMETSCDYVLIDVREEEEYITGHAVDAVLLPVDDIDERSAAAVIPGHDTDVLVYCRSGRRSRDAAAKLSELGYNNIYDMGSLIGWPYGIE